MANDTFDHQTEPDKDNIVRVTILGQEYPIRADANADYIREIAVFLDARMRAVHQAEPSRPPLKIAVLTALNLADELYHLKRQNQEMIEKFDSKAKQFSEYLDQKLTD